MSDTTTLHPWLESLRKRFPNWPGWRDGFTVVFFDWSIRRGVQYVVDDDMAGTIRPSLDAMLDDFKGRHCIFIGEATFSSFVLEQRAEFVRRMKDDHLFFTTATRLTGKRRRRHGMDTDEAGNIIKSDSLAGDLSAALTFRLMAQAGVHLAAPALLNAQQQKRKDANDELRMLRCTVDHMNKRPRSEGYTSVSKKEVFARYMTTKLPPFSSLDDSKQKALGDGKGYNLIAVAAAAVAAKHSDNVKEYDYLTGLYDHAYPSQIRADLMHYVWAGGNQRAKLIDKGPGGRKDGLTLTEFRRSIRWLYPQLKGIFLPDTGTKVSVS